MAVRKQSMVSSERHVDLRDGAGRAAERDWRTGSVSRSPSQRRQLRDAIRAARREHLRRSLETVIQIAAWLSCAILLTFVGITALRPADADALVAWIDRLAEPLMQPFVGLLPQVQVLGAVVETNALLAASVIWLVSRGAISALRLMLGEQVSDAWESSSPFGGSRS